MELLTRVETGLFVEGDAGWRRIDIGLDELLSKPLADIRRVVDEAQPADKPDGVPLAPIEGQEVWAAGVTYRRSLAARAEEAVSADPYERVYEAARPELFFKADSRRVRGPGRPVRIRADSTWDVPEPELAVVCNSHLEVVGYTIGNDVSSRSIEGENTLYLPLAQVDDGSSATVKFRGETSTSAMRRGIAELVEYLGREQTFPVGCVLLTGTGVVPPADITLRDGDVVTIRIEGIGELVNPVERLTPPS